MSNELEPEWATRLQGHARSVRWQAGATRWQVAREAAAVHFLSSHLQTSRFLPPIGGWSVDYSVVAAILDFVRQRDRAITVLELGSGSGTPWLATIAAQTGGRLISVEHDATHVERTRALVRYYGLEATCTVVHAPLTDETARAQPDVDDSSPWYDLGPVVTALGDDLVEVLLVDGPPSTVGPHARQPALFAVEHHLADEALVVLDDVVRDDERDTFTNWQVAFGDRMLRLPLLDRAELFLLRTSESPAQRMLGGRHAADVDEEPRGGSSDTL